jgi:hypothetical protein
LRGLLCDCAKEKRANSESADPKTVNPRFKQGGGRPHKDRLVETDREVEDALVVVLAVDQREAEAEGDWDLWEDH